jgi:hypothetical protein
MVERPPQRIEIRSEAPVRVERPTDPMPAAPPRPRVPAPSGEGWSEPRSGEQATFALYRPRRGAPAQPAEEAPHPIRAEARREL